jgi:hypothetical protein
MDVSRSRAGVMIALGVGVALGWMASGFRARPMWAGSGDRAGECIVTTGPVLMQYDDATKAPIALEAVYFLDYKGGRLLATVPTYRLAAGKMEFIDGFAERDLAADFRLELEGGQRPRFLMTTGGLGRYSSGWAPLYVFETTTGQVGIYRVQVGQAYGANAPAQFELVEMRSYLKPAGGAARP